MDVVDPNEELTWLANELYTAEKNRERVYLLGHIPPGHTDLMPAWTHYLDQIVNRYVLQVELPSEVYG
jgi:sphingomyelin phosphodiesterase